MRYTIDLSVGIEDQNVFDNANDVLRGERNLQVCFAPSHGLGATHSVPVSALDTCTQLQWDIVGDVPETARLLVTVLCDTETFFGNDARVLWATASVLLRDVAAGIEQQSIELVNTSAEAAYASRPDVFRKARLCVRHMRTSDALSFVPVPLVSRYDDMCEEFKTQQRAAGADLAPCVPKIAAYHIEEYPHPYLRRTGVPLGLALTAGPERLAFAPTRQMFERMLDAAFVVENVSRARFVSRCATQFAQSGAQFLVPFGDCLAVASRMLTIWANCTPYTFDVVSRGKRSARHKFSAAAAGVTDNSVALPVDGVLTLDCGGAMDRVAGDCDDGVATAQCFLATLRQLDVGEGTALAWAARVLQCYQWISTIAYCGDNGNERDHHTDRGVCHAFLLGIPRPVYLEALRRGCKHRLEGKHPHGAAVSRAVQNIDRELAQFRGTAAWVRRLSFLTLETTNMLWGPLTIVGDCSPDHPEASERRRAAFDRQERWMGACGTNAPAVAAQWMYLSAEDKIDKQRPCYREQFVRDPDAHRLYVFYLYNVMGAVDANDAVWDGDEVAVQVLYADRACRRYGCNLQQVVLDPGRLSLIPSVVARRTALRAMQDVAWGTAFPAYFCVTDPDFFETPCVESASREPFFRDAELSRYRVEKSHRAPIATLYALPSALTGEARAQFARVLHKTRRQFSAQRLHVHEGRVLYKLDILDPPRRSGACARRPAAEWRPRSISFSRCNLQRAPESIREVSGVHELDLSHNALQTLPRSMSHMRSLRRLDVRNNRLRTLPSVLTELPLRTLDAAHNRLWTIRDVFGMHALLELDVSHNQLVDVDGAWNTCPELERLDLSGNPLLYAPASLSGATSLQTLRIADARLADVASELSVLTNLRTLDLSENHLQALSLDFRRMEALETLALSDNDVVALPFGLSEAPMLTSVDVRHNPLRFVNAPAHCVVELD